MAAAHAAAHLAAVSPVAVAGLAPGGGAKPRMPHARASVSGFAARWHVLVGWPRRMYKFSRSGPPQT